jgi:hypothetical protein
MNDMIGFFLLACFAVAFFGGSYELVMWLHRLTYDWVAVASIYGVIGVIVVVVFGTVADRMG